ncbi:small ubiquitin-related modifier 2 [Ricinus communis]|uniref:Ubiquitin-like domain-containing protein n=1 Tax=Ricinus communis TaxID=3988 RepID=B9RWG0_RICCO|nr:small ubiquitin-related modifier 2 [Ricinus communis]EEF44212.1 conserved hypothetical protein [Ricinus communis]|eukprot:XP_002518079.1 small ubiquitin-related modifier 2 [Ricinus communis]
MESFKTITVRVRSQDGREKVFRIKMDTQMSKLIARYCEDRQWEPHTAEFLLNGLRFPRDKTPAQLNLKDNVLIEAMMHQNGGGSKAFSMHALYL